VPDNPARTQKIKRRTMKLRCLQHATTAS
jgi:hypothetical protein